MKNLFLHSRNFLLLAGVLFIIIVFMVVNAFVSKRDFEANELLANLSTIRRDSSIILAPCTINDSRYSELFFTKNPLESWPSLYGEQVNKILEEAMQPINPENIDCFSDDPLASQTLPELTALAASLPPWQKQENLDSLKNTDMGFVLMEYLRVYECALKERDLFLRQSILDEQWQNLDDPNITNDSPREITEGELLAKSEYERKIINKELAISRPLLERALMMQTGKTKLNALDMELVCMQRASLDLRNGLALSAEASACLPRAWNAKDVLRDIQESFYVNTQ